MVDLLQVPWPSSSAVLRELLSIQSDSSCSLSCHGQTKKHTKCKVHISKSNTATVNDLLNRIIAAGSLTAARSLLANVSRLVMCQRFHQDQGEGFLNKWLRKLAELREWEDNDDSAISSAPSPRSRARSTPPSSPSTRSHARSTPTSTQASTPASTPTPPSSREASPTSTPTRISALTTVERPARSTPTPDRTSNIRVRVSPSTEAPTAIHDFSPFGPRKTTIELNKHIMSLVRRPLLVTERKDKEGFIYAFTFPEQYGLARPAIKIGYTNNLDRRAAQWGRQCGYTPRKLMDVTADHHVKVEKLVHAQLRNRRMRESCCPGCNKDHIEWFDVQICRIAEVVTLWAQWMRMKPYDEEGKLREEWEVKLNDVDLTKRNCWKLFILDGEEAETQE